MSEGVMRLRRDGTYSICKSPEDRVGKGKCCHINDKNIITAYHIAEKIEERGGTVYYVGGFVRDSIIHKPNKDVDIEIHNIEPQEVKEVLSEFGTVESQGAAFGVYNIHGYDIDIAQPRTEKSTGGGYTDFEVNVDPYIGVEKAAKRRDFTINAIMKNARTGEIVDPFNGQKDLKDGIIRHVNDDAFNEDPLRVLRAAQFAARFGFKIAPETKKLMKKSDVSKLSKERVWLETEKALLKSKKPSIFFETLRETDQLDHWFPELKALIGSEQSKKHHPEGDVWTHTMKVLDSAAKERDKSSDPESFMLAALCHDLGKPKSQTIDEKGIIHNYGHENTGQEVAEDFLNRINPNVKTKKYVKNMIKLHMRAHTLAQNNSKVAKTNQLFDESICPRDLCLIAKVDKHKRKESQAEYKFLSERCQIYEDRMKEPQVMGRDLVDLGLKPGKEFSDILKDAHKQHLSGVDKKAVLKGIRTKYVK